MKYWRILLLCVIVVVTALRLIFGETNTVEGSQRIEQNVVVNYTQITTIINTTTQTDDITRSNTIVLSDRWKQLSRSTLVSRIDSTKRTEFLCSYPKSGPSSKTQTKICSTTQGGHCGYSITVTDVNGCRFQPQKVTSDKHYASILNDVGSSSFRLRLVSHDEVVIPNLVLFKESDCSYKFEGIVKKQGTFIIEAEIWYRDYLAYEEMKSETPPMAREYLFASNETLTKKGKAIEGAQHLSPDKNLFHFLHPVYGKILKSGKFRASKNYIWDQFTLSTAEVFTCPVGQEYEPLISNAVRCNGQSSGILLQPGSWLAISDAPDLGDEFSHTHFERYYPKRQYQWSPNHCSLPKFTPQTVRKCLSGKTLVFTGDSHMRVLFTYITNLLVEDEGSYMDPEVKRMDGLTVTNGNNTTIRLINDIYLERHSLAKLSEDYDVVVAGFGSWCLGGGGKNPDGRVIEDVGRWSYKRYTSRVEHLAKDWSGKSSKVWVNIPAYPPNQRRFSKLKGEYRTTPRIQFFNTAAETSMLSHNIPIVDIFSPSQAMIHTSLDHNHFLGYVQDAAVHQFLNLICI